MKKLFTWQGGHLVVFEAFLVKTMHSPNVQMIKPRKFIEVNLVVGFFFTHTNWIMQ